MIRNWNRSLTLRLTMLFALASALVLFLLGLLIGRSVEQHFAEQDVDALTGKMKLARYALSKALPSGENGSLARQLDDALTGHHGLMIAVYGPGQRLLYANRDLDFFAPLSRSHVVNGTGQPFRWIANDGLPWRGIFASFRLERAPDATYGVAVATEISHHEHFMHEFRNTLWLFITLAAVAMGLLGWWVVRRELTPLQSLKKQAGEITAKRLYTRLPAESIPPELADLADTLNAMLSRLEESFQRLSDFSSDLAHELRTPLCNLLTQTQVTLSKARSADEYRDVLASNAEEFEQLSRMIADMLFLAQAENKQIIPNREQLDLADEVASLLDFYKILAEEKNIHLAAHGHGIVSGDRLMLRRAISNLLSNALHHTPENGSVEVEIQQHDQTVSVNVKNTGADIAEEHLSRLFDRFYRADSSRRRTTEGSGLGLAIVRSILIAHGGNTSVISAAGITCFTLVLPAIPESKLDESE